MISWRQLYNDACEHLNKLTTGESSEVKFKHKGFFGWTFIIKVERD